MVRTRQWYEKKDPQEQWGLTFAMMTIAGAQETQGGKATWLRQLDDGEPLKKTACPFSSPDRLPDQIREKDWTAYEGVLHTDHSIRDEFFVSGLEPPRMSKPWLMDFTYIYDHTKEDYVRFLAGKLVSEEEVFQDIGPPGEWRTLGAEIPKRTRSAARELKALLHKCERWALPKRTLAGLLK